VKRLEPGDYIWVYDPRPDAALYDVANEITFHGETLMPMSMRLEAITWPVQEGMGVYFRYWDGAAFTTVDLSNHVVYETGESTLDVGAAQRRLTTDPTPAQTQARITPGGDQQESDSGNRTFTNTGFLDLDALTGGAGTLPAVAVTVTTGTRVKVTITANISNATLGAVTAVGYRISGTTTAAAADGFTLFYESGAANDQIQASWSSVRAVTAGSNTFELQARVTAGTGFLQRPEIIVEPFT
jgi:hypothetical protein